MNVKPILFSSGMVRALLDGRKTQTRRVVKYRNYAEQDAPVYPHECPYGRPGDLLWVRETLRCDGFGVWRYGADRNRVFLNSDDQTAMIVWAHHKDGDVCTSIHMPRWASRLTLRLTGVLVQRVQEISEGDAIAEGWKPFENDPPGNGGPFDWYRHLWDSINAKRGHEWDSNPWVWALTFEVIQQNVDNYIYTKAVA